MLLQEEAQVGDKEDTPRPGEVRRLLAGVGVHAQGPGALQGPLVPLGVPEGVSAQTGQHELFKGSHPGQRWLWPQFA